MESSLICFEKERDMRLASETEKYALLYSSNRLGVGGERRTYTMRPLHRSTRRGPYADPPVSMTVNSIDPTCTSFDLIVRV
jgi:hypothetical protein